MRFKAKTNEYRGLDVEWDLVDKYLSQWPPGTVLDFSVTKKKNTVSQPLRKYYYAVVLPKALEAFGYDPDEWELVHRQLKIVYFHVEPDKRGIYRNVPSLFGNDSDKDNKIKTGFIDWIKRKAAEQGVYIPDPNEVDNV